MLARMIAAAGRRAAAGDPEELTRLRALVDQVAAALSVAVAGLRSNGHTWSSIGEATGTTRQAAIMKWAAPKASA